MEGVQSVPITAKVVSLNPVHGKVYSIQHYVTDTPVSSTNKTDCHDITEILLKVALNTVSLNQTYNSSKFGKKHSLDNAFRN